MLFRGKEHLLFRIPAHCDVPVTSSYRIIHPSASPTPDRFSISSRFLLPFLLTFHAAETYSLSVRDTVRIVLRPDTCLLALRRQVPQPGFLTSYFHFPKHNRPPPPITQQGFSIRKGTLEDLNPENGNHQSVIQWTFHIKELPKCGQRCS